MGVLLIARFTFKEVIRRRLFLAVLLLSIFMLGGFALLFNYAVDHSRVPTGIDPQLYSSALGIFAIVPIIWLAYLLSSFMTIRGGVVFSTAGLVRRRKTCPRLTNCHPALLHRSGPGAGLPIDCQRTDALIAVDSEPIERCAAADCRCI